MSTGVHCVVPNTGGRNTLTTISKVGITVANQTENGSTTEYGVYLVGDYEVYNIHTSAFNSREVRDKTETTTLYSFKKKKKTGRADYYLRWIRIIYKVRRFISGITRQKKPNKTNLYWTEEYSIRRRCVSKLFTFITTEGLFLLIVPNASKYTRRFHFK